MKEAPQTLTVETADGSHVSVPLREADHRVPGKPPDYWADCSSVKPCPRCGGCADENGIAQGGLISYKRCWKPTRSWHPFVAACGCAFGALHVWRQERIGRSVPFFDHLNCVPHGLSVLELNALFMHVKKLGTLLEAAERIPNPDRRARVVAAVLALEETNPAMAPVITGTAERKTAA